MWHGMLSVHIKCTITINNSFNMIMLHNQQQQQQIKQQQHAHHYKTNSYVNFCRISGSGLVCVWVRNMLLALRVICSSSVRLTFLICSSIYMLNAINGEMILRVDPLALLSATLRTYQKVACDTDQILVSCPRGTSISIEFAQYNNFIATDGISIEELCPAQNESSGRSSSSLNDDVHLQFRARAKHLLRGSIFALSTHKVPASAAKQMAPPSTVSTILRIPTVTTTTTKITTKINTTTVIQNNNNNNKFNNISIVSEEPIENLNNTNNNDNNSTNLEMPEHNTENCLWPNALQYSLLQTVVEACQKKKHCRFSGSAPYYSIGSSGVGDTSGTSSYHTSTGTNTNVSSTNNNNFSKTYNNMASNSSTTNGRSNYTAGSGRPCPKQRKIVEIAYKCRPYEFRSKVACHNDVAQLECNPYSRIAVYSASFGRTEYESIQCPQPQGVREETCLATYATETVMQICHGRRRCNLAADANTFGTPCQPNSRMYLKVVYTCVPRQVLKERYESDIESDETNGDHSEINELYDDDLNYKESEAIPKLYSNTTATAHTIPRTATKTNSSEANSSFVFDLDTDIAGTGGTNPVMTHSADLSLEDDRERIFLYVLICGSAIVIIAIVVIAMRLIIQKREILATNTHSPTSMKMTKDIGGATNSGEALSSSLTNSFNEAISQIDAQIDETSTKNHMPVANEQHFLTHGPKINSNLNIPSNVYDIATPNNVQGFQVVGGVTASVGPTNTTNTVNPALIANPLAYGHRASPDIIGISSSAFSSALRSAASNNSHSFTSVQAQTTGDDKQIALDGILAPAIVIGSGNSVVDTIAVSCDGRVMGTLPLSALTQYTTAPTFHASYIINADAVMANPQMCFSTQPSPTTPRETPPPPPPPIICPLFSSSTTAANTAAATTTTAPSHQQSSEGSSSCGTATPNQLYNSPLTQQQQKHQQQQGILKSQQIPFAHSNNQINSAMQSATLRRNKVTFEQQQQQQQQYNISYDGIAPRTLSTGVPINSKFYYG